MRLRKIHFFHHESYELYEWMDLSVYHYLLVKVDAEMGTVYIKKSQES